MTLQQVVPDVAQIDEANGVGTGPAGLLALFAHAQCQDPAHETCERSRCPCGDARAWLRTLPATMPLATIWGRCRRLDWMRWLLQRARLTSPAQTCKELREEVPWSAVQEALLARRKGKAVEECQDCSEEVDVDSLLDGRCEGCDSHYVYCAVCPERVHQDSLCDHLEWSDAAGDEVGTGSDHDHADDFDRFLTKLGRRRVRKLREQITSGAWWTWKADRLLSDAVEKIGERARDADDDVEVGWIWLITLGPDQRLKEHVRQTIQWIDDHLKARQEEIDADPRPRWVIRDGGRRYFVGGEWTAIREHGAWMRRSRAHRTARVLRAAYPTAVVRVVHVLTPHHTKGSR